MMITEIRKRFLSRNWSLHGMHSELALDGVIALISQVQDRGNEQVFSDDFLKTDLLSLRYPKRTYLSLRIVAGSKSKKLIHSSHASDLARPWSLG